MLQQQCTGFCKIKPDRTPFPFLNRLGAVPKDLKAFSLMTRLAGGTSASQDFSEN
jgi:hypothetical protein